MLRLATEACFKNFLRELPLNPIWLRMLSSSSLNLSVSILSFHFSSSSIFNFLRGIQIFTIGNLETVIDRNITFKIAYNILLLREYSGRKVENKNYTTGALKNPIPLIHLN